MKDDKSITPTPNTEWKARSDYDFDKDTVETHLWKFPLDPNVDYSLDLVHPYPIGCSLTLVNRTDDVAKALVEKYGSIHLGNCKGKE